FSAPFRDQLPPHVAHLPFPDPLRGVSEEQALAAVRRFMAEGGKTSAGPVGAIIYEVIQGRGGVRPAGNAFLRGLKDLARQHGLLLIADEVMTGLGRTGKDFASEHSGVVPDLLCLGKALSNGFPLSACIGRPDIMAAWPPSDGEAIHTSTFLGNPLGCAM